MEFFDARIETEDNVVTVLNAAAVTIANATPPTDIGYLRDSSIKVTTEPPQQEALDGELIGTTPVEIECIPSSLTILVPKLS